MNRQLRKLGQKSVPEKLRKTMTAPPHDWKAGLAKSWKSAEEAMTSGTASFVLEIEKDGQGLQGAHVLLKTNPPKPKSNVFRSGIDANTLFLNTAPMGWLGGFGYRGGDIAKTRYGFTDAKGRVRFDKLPEGPMKIEVMVPTGNFAEEGGAWELWMEVEPGQFKVATQDPRPNSQRPSDPISQVNLVAGKVTKYPRLVVRPKSGLNLHDFASVPAKGFDLQWTPPSRGEKQGELRYQVRARPHRAPAASLLAPDDSGPEDRLPRAHRVATSHRPQGHRGDPRHPPRSGQPLLGPRDGARRR